MFNAVRYMVRAGCPWRMIPNNLPPWYSVQQQAQRWIKAGCFEAMGHHLRKVLRLLVEKPEEPSAVIIDGRTLRSTPESGRRAGYDGHKRKKGSKVHAAVDSLGHLLALKVTAANEQERAHVGALLAKVQAATGEKVQVAFVDQGYTGENPPPKRPRREFASLSSNSKKPSEVLSSCRGAGWWSAPLLGPPASADWSKITKDCLLPWLDCTGWPSLLSCSTSSFIKVHTPLKANYSQRDKGAPKPLWRA